MCKSFYLWPNQGGETQMAQKKRGLFLERVFFKLETHKVFFCAHVEMCEMNIWGQCVLSSSFIYFWTSNGDAEMLKGEGASVIKGNIKTEKEMA